MVALSVFRIIYSMRVHASLAIGLIRLWMNGFYVLCSCRCVQILLR